MALEEFVEELSNRFGGAALAPDELGRYVLTFDGGLQIILAHPHEGLYRITGAVGELPGAPDEAQALLVKLLHWNFPRQKTQREILALEPNETQLTLFREGPTTHLKPYEFADVVESFLNSLEYWRAAAKPEKEQRIRHEEPPPPMIIMP